MDTIDGADRRITYVKSKIRGYHSTEEHVRILLSNGARTFGDIQKELQATEVKIGIRGLHKIIDRLRTRGIIEKVPANPYPLYFLTEKGIHDTGLMADFFLNTFNHILNNMPPLIYKSREKSIKKIVEIGGLFNVYSYLVTWDFTGKPQQVEEKRQSWFRNIGIPGTLVIWLEDHLVWFWSEKEVDTFYKSEAEKRPIQKKAAQKFKKILYTIYPEEMKRYDTQFQELEEQVKNYHKLVKKQSMDSMKQLLSELS